MNTYNFLIIYIITLDIATWHNLWRVYPVKIKNPLRFLAVLAVKNMERCGEERHLWNLQK